MRGTCPTCQQRQAEGVPDYCCVRCTLTKAGYEAIPKSDTPTTREGAIITEVTQRGATWCIECEDGLVRLTPYPPDGWLIACDTCGHLYDED